MQTAGNRSERHLLKTPPLCNRQFQNQGLEWDGQAPLAVFTHMRSDGVFGAALPSGTRLSVIPDIVLK